MDTTFDPGSGTDAQVYSIAIQTNGQVVIAGSFTSFNGVFRTNVARLNSNGTLDSAFDPGSAFGAFPFTYAITLQPGGKVLAGGSFVSSQITNLARLNTNGALDTSFVAATDANGTVSALAVQTNGSIIVGGSFVQLNGVAHASLGRVGSNGGVDNSFNPSLSGGFAEALALAVQSDGKILVAGSFTNMNGTTRTNLARLNADGTVDTGFKPSSMNGGSYAPASPGLLNAVAIDGQGRVVVGGDFNTINGQVRTNLARFNSDGSLDMTFNPAAGTDSAVNSVVLEPYGKILIGGYFNLVNGVTNNFVARLNSDGSLDHTFNTGSGPDQVVSAIALQSDGKILIGGGFTTYNGANRSGIARLQNTITIPPPLLVTPSLSNGVFRVSVATVNGKSYVLQYKNALSDSVWTGLPAVQGDGTTKVLTDPGATVSKRFYQVGVQ